MNLLTWRDMAGLTTAQFAKRCGINRCAMHRIMQGRGDPSPLTARAIVRETDGAVTMSDLFPVRKPKA